MRILFITPAENEFKREKEGCFDALEKLISEIKKDFKVHYTVYPDKYTLSCEFGEGPAACSVYK